MGKLYKNLLLNIVQICIKALQCSAEYKSCGGAFGATLGKTILNVFKGKIIKKKKKNLFQIWCFI
jgi:hypothetical protein